MALWKGGHAKGKTSSGNTGGGSWWGRRILSGGRRGRGVVRSHARATWQRRGNDWIVSSSACKVMLHPDVVGKFEELAVLDAVSAREPARLRGVQNQTSGDTSHDIFRGDVGVMLLIPDGLHDVLEAVVGDAGLDIIADELPIGQGPRLIWSKSTPSVHGSRYCLRHTLQHGCRSAFVGSWVALEAFLPIPASCVGSSNVGGGDKVVAIVSHVLLVLGSNVA